MSFDDLSGTDEELIETMQKTVKNTST